MSAVDDSVATVAVVVLVSVNMEAKEFVTAFVAVAVIVIIAAIGGNQNAATVADMIPVMVLVVGAIGIFLTFCFLSTDVANCVFVLIHMIIASEFCFTFIAEPVTVGVCADIGHPRVTFITAVVAVFIYMILAKFLHTVSRVIAIVTSSVFIKIIAVVTHPKTAIVAVVIDVFISVQKIVILIAPLEIFQASITESVLVFVHVDKARN